ncbi:MAG: tetratricopeptide repeat protein [Bacteroidetes bacterium]|nr:tetratricopeptide repeat protein [Bacteroidota bacterium]
MSIWDDALLQNPSCVKAYGGRGNGYNDKQMYQQAIQDLNKAIELKTDYADAYYNRGLAYYFIAKQNQDAGKSDDASRYYSLSIQDNSEAIKYKPNLARAYFNRSGNYFILKQFDLALTDVLKAKELGMEVDPAYIEFLKKQIISK